MRSIGAVIASVLASCIACSRRSAVALADGRVPGARAGACLRRARPWLGNP